MKGIFYLFSNLKQCIWTLLCCAGVCLVVLLFICVAMASLCLPRILVVYLLYYLCVFFFVYYSVLCFSTNIFRGKCSHVMWMIFGNCRLQKEDVLIKHRLRWRSKNEFLRLILWKYVSFATNLCCIKCNSSLSFSFLMSFGKMYVIKIF